MINELEYHALRRATIDAETAVYVSDSGYVVLAQGVDDDLVHVAINPENVPAVIAALQRLLPVASAKQSVIDVCIQAEHQVWLQRNGEAQ